MPLQPANKEQCCALYGNVLQWHHSYSMSLCTTYMAEEAATGDCRSPRDVRKSKVPGCMAHFMFRMRSSYDLLKKLEQKNLQVKCSKWEERTSSYGKFYCF